MKEYKGISASVGIAIGPAVKYIHTSYEDVGNNSDSTAENVYSAGIASVSRESEFERFLAAREQVKAELENSAEEARSMNASEMADLYDVNTVLLYDSKFEEMVKSGIIEKKLDVVSAVYSAGESMSEILLQTDDEYMRARADDISDIALRICNKLSGKGDFNLSEPSILISDDLSPAETMGLSRDKLLGIVLTNGSMNGHTAILARMLGIPLVISVKSLRRKEDDISEELKSQARGFISVRSNPLKDAEVFEEDVIVDGNAGTLLIKPGESEKEEYRRKLDMARKHSEELRKYAGGKSVSGSGKQIKIYCNIGSPRDVTEVVENDGEGIGLFRTEFLFMESLFEPTEQMQFEAYKAVLEAMPDKEVIIRTCDIGSDKKIPYYKLPEEANPALGLRAVRVSITCPDLLITQLRALYRASAYGKLGIMFPMIANVWEILEVKKMCREVCADLASEGIAYDPKVKIGMMVETPAAALISEEFTKEVDFFSIGTNDLIQYTLACDRTNEHTMRFTDNKHPAVLKLIEMTAKSAHQSGIPIGICGDMASDPGLLDFFLSIGIDELSVSPKDVLPLREHLAKL